MAGHYFYDPRPFYGHNGHTGLMPLDELFYGRYEPTVPYWMDQRMAPFEPENYYGPGNKQMVSRRVPEIMQQQYIPQRGENNFMAFKRPEMVRDDMYTDMYRRSPYNFNYNYGAGAVAVAPAAMHPEIMRQQQQFRGQTQDDTWVHTANSPAHGHGQSFPGSRGLAEPPPGTTTRFATGPGTGNGNGNGNEQYRPMPNGNQGGDQYRQMDQSMGQPMLLNNSHMNNNQSNNSRDNFGNHGNHGSKLTGVSGNVGQQNGSFGQVQNGSFGQGKSLGQGGKSNSMQMTTSKQLSGGNNVQKQNRYHNDSSSNSDSDDDDDDYRGHGHNNGASKWGTVKSSSSLNHGHSGGKANSSHGHKVDSSHGGYESLSRGVKNSSLSSHSKKSYSGNSHGNSYSKSSSKHGSQSKIAKLFGGRDDSSSSEDDESYNHGHSKNGSSKGGSKGGSQQMHGSHVSSFQPNYGGQPKQMQFSSQSKSVELKVPICCDNCERKVRTCLAKLDGVESVLCDQWNRKVIVYGNLKAENVLKRVRRVKKTSELWQQAKQQQLRLY